MMNKNTEIKVLKKTHEILFLLNCTLINIYGNDSHRETFLEERKIS